MRNGTASLIGKRGTVDTSETQDMGGSWGSCIDNCNNVPVQEVPVQDSSNSPPYLVNSQNHNHLSTNKIHPQQLSPTFPSVSS